MSADTAKGRVEERLFENKLLVNVPGYEKADLFKGIASQYEETHRAYHTFEHIDFCLNIFDKFRHLANNPDCLELAIIFHDLRYGTDVPARVNEEISALALVEVMLRYKCLWKDTLCGMSAVLATTHDHTPSTDDNKLIVDIDLAGLGQPWDIFLENNRNVRQEYKDVPEDKFREGNGAVLQRFLDRTPLYYHPEIEARYGAQAKENLARWLNRS